MIKILLLLFFILALPLSAQQDIVLPILKDIEAGNLESAQAKFDQIKFKHKDEPAIIFVEGLLNINADDAVKSFKKVYNSHPKSKYADAAVFRIYSFYTAIGDNAGSEKYLSILKGEYPKSPYLAGITKNQPTPLTETRTDTKPSGESRPVIKESFYTLQAGAFSVLRNALVLKDKLARAGWSVEIREKPVAGANFFIVFAGAYGSENEAKAGRDKLNKEQSLDSRIVSLEK